MVVIKPLSYTLIHFYPFQGALGQIANNYSISTDLEVSAYAYNCTSTDISLHACLTEPGCLSQQTALVTCQGMCIIYRV